MYDARVMIEGDTSEGGVRKWDESEAGAREYPIRERLVGGVI